MTPSSATTSPLRRSARRVVVQKHGSATPSTTTSSAARLTTVAAAVAAATTSPSGGAALVAEAFTPVRGKRSFTASIKNVTPENPSVARKLSSEETDEKKPSLATNKKAKKSKKQGNAVGRTESFGAATAASWPHLSSDQVTPLHTLILGTHPSQESFRQAQYYGHIMNAFWWMTGDCLGFRRASGISPSTGKPYKFTDALRPEFADSILSYEEQVSCFVGHGFGLWDIVESCERPGSLDKDIKNAKANDIRQLARENPHLRRIVIANGGEAADLFKSKFADWCASGELRANDDAKSQKMLGKKLSAGNYKGRITVVVAPSPSPAAASMSYTDKRDFWETHVFEPGKRDYMEWKEGQKK